MLRLLFTVGDETYTHVLTPGTYVVGRGRACDVIIPHGSVSVQHVRLDVHETEVCFRDLLSSNGTWVHGERAQNGTLRPGERLWIGPVAIRLHVDASGVPEDDALLAAAADVTPVASSCVPAPASHQAVVVVRPASTRLPASLHAVRQRLAKHPIAYACSAAVLLLFVVLLCRPRQEAPDPIVRRLTYWTEVRRGARAFEAGDYAQAQTTWSAAHERLARLRRESAVNPTAGFLAELAQLLACPPHGRARLAVPWDQHMVTVRRLVQERHASEIESFMVGPVLTLCREHAEAQRLRLQARACQSRGAFEQAIELLRAVPAHTFYAQGVKEAVTACQRGAVDAIRTRALAHAAAGEWIQGIEVLKTVPPGARTPQDRKNQERWEQEAAADECVAELRAAQAGKGPEAWQRGLDLCQRLRHDFPTRAALLKLTTVEQDLQHRLFMFALQLKVSTWDGTQDAFAVEQADPRAQHADAQALLRHVALVQHHLGAYEKALEMRDYLAARQALDTARKAAAALGLDAQHPLLLRIAALKHAIRDEVLARLFREAGDSFYAQEAYAKARQAYAKARAYGADVTTGEKRLRRSGITFLNRGNRAVIDDQPVLAARCYEKALACLSPEDPLYEIARGKREALRSRFQGQRFDDVER